MFGDARDDDTFANYLNQGDINSLAADRQAINKEKQVEIINDLQDNESKLLRKNGELTEALTKLLETHTKVSPYS